MGDGEEKMDLGNAYKANLMNVGGRRGDNDYWFPIWVNWKGGRSMS